MSRDTFVCIDCGFVFPKNRNRARGSVRCKVCLTKHRSRLKSEAYNLLSDDEQKSELLRYADDLLHGRTPQQKRYLENQKKRLKFDVQTEGGIDMQIEYVDAIPYTVYGFGMSKETEEVMNLCKNLDIGKAIKFSPDSAAETDVKKLRNHCSSACAILNRRGNGNVKYRVNQRRNDTYISRIK